MSISILLSVLFSLFVGWYFSQPASPKLAFALVNRGTSRRAKLDIRTSVMRSDAPASGSTGTVSSKTFANYEDIIDLTVIDRNGVETGEKRVIVNLPLRHFFPTITVDDIVIVNWLWDNADRPTVDVLKKPITYKGKTYYGFWSWGSAVKKGYTFGLTRDILRTSGLGSKSEDGLRAGRAFFPHALYGAATGPQRIYIAKEHEVINGLPIEDGFGYTTESNAKVVRNIRTPIKLGDVRDSFHFIQRLKWTVEFAAESVPLILARLVTMADPITWFKDIKSKFDKKFELVSLDAKMMKHPFVANALTRTSQERASRLASTIPLEAVYRTAAPTLAKTIAAIGKFVIGRYPIDSNSSTRAITADADKAEIERINKMPVAQYTLLSSEMFAKGNLGVVPDDKLVIKGNQYDVILCVEDIKMAVPSVKQFKGRETYNCDDVYLGFTEFWAAGSAFGISADFWKKMGGDFDGDGVVVVDCSKRPELYKAVELLPEQPSYKLPKTDTSFEQSGDQRAEMIVKSFECAVIVGFATNVAAATFTTSNREELATALGYQSIEKLDNLLNNLIKVGTDGFKCNVDTAQAEKTCAVLQSNIVKLMGKGAPWCNWGRDAYAFRNAVPEFYHPGMNKEEIRIGIPPHFNGTIAQICRITLPEINNFLKIQIEGEPLSHYRRWAASAPDSLYAEIDQLQMRYNTRIKSTNFSDENALGQFNAWWDFEMREWCAKHSDLPKQTMANALWRSAHESRSAMSGAGSILGCEFFKDEVANIITHKPGLKEGGEFQYTVLVGLHYALRDKQLETVEADVEVVEHTYKNKDGKPVTRHVVTGKVPGQKPANPGWPENTLATVDLNCNQPECGKYHARIVRNTAASWKAELKPVK